MAIRAANLMFLLRPLIGELPGGRCPTGPCMDPAWPNGNFFLLFIFFIASVGFSMVKLREKYRGADAGTKGGG